MFLSTNLISLMMQYLFRLPFFIVFALAVLIFQGVGPFHLNEFMGKMSFVIFYYSFNVFRLSSDILVFISLSQLLPFLRNQLLVLLISIFFFFPICSSFHLYVLFITVFLLVLSFFFFFLRWHFRSMLCDLFLF